MRPTTLYRSTFLNIDSYKKIKSKLPKKMKYKEFTEIIKRMSELITEEIFNNTYGFELPLGLGTLVIVGDENPKKNVDWYQTKKYFQETGEKKLIYHKNSHTNGTVYSLRWTRYSQGRRNYAPRLRLYIFRPARVFSQKLLAHLKTGKFRHFFRTEEAHYSKMRQIFALAEDKTLNTIVDRDLIVKKTIAKLNRQREEARKRKNNDN